ALYFRPKLAENEYFTMAQGHPITGNVNIGGTLNELDIPKLNLGWNNTALTGEGQLFQVSRPDSLSFDISKVSATTTKADLKLFVGEKELNMALPQTILVEARAKGSLKSITGEALMKIPEGTAQIS